ncbi:hypothetical protein SADUNF_Sadunf03G0080100 [Salix dunnii]|uniref:Uncharacterized protein n=1 Tax=Salix dunnii TaxID=1413687 RepID=A0A835N3D2_9ROSI|nr:hypothetical protein SADUNF_Sadunf03G0080100 [Salix dunnii]
MEMLSSNNMTSRESGAGILVLSQGLQLLFIIAESLNHLHRWLIKIQKGSAHMVAVDGFGHPNLKFLIKKREDFPPKQPRDNTTRRPTLLVKLMGITIEY